METQYAVNITKDGKMEFTKDTEIVEKEHDRLVIAINEHMDMSMGDAEIYAQWLKNTCMYQYQLEFSKYLLNRGRKN